MRINTHQLILPPFQRVSLHTYTDQFVNSFLNIFDFNSFNSRDHAGDISDVQGTAWDLRTKTNIGEVIHSVPGGIGYDHNYCFGKTGWQKYMARYL